MQLNENQEKDVLNVLRENKVVPYHPQISGQVEVSNWEIKMILEKMVNQTTKIGLLGSIWEFIREWNGMIKREWKGMECI